MGLAIKGVLFDKDGTLIDYHLTWGPINRQAAAIAGNGDDDLAARLLDIGGMDDATGITRSNSLLAAGNTVEIAEAWVAAGSPVERSVLIAALDELFVRSARNSVPIVDMAAYFAALRAEGYAVGIASSDSEAAIRMMLHHFDAIDHVDFIAGYDSGHGCKPGPGMVVGFSSKTGVAVSDVAVVGDNPHDMEMGHSAGVGLKVAVMSGTGTADVLTAMADVCLPHIGHLPDELRRRRSA